jgi:hypothetical protein
MASLSNKEELIGEIILLEEQMMQFNWGNVQFSKEMRKIIRSEYEHENLETLEQIREKKQDAIFWNEERILDNV